MSAESDTGYVRPGEAIALDETITVVSVDLSIIPTVIVDC